MEKLNRALNRFWRAPIECQLLAQVSGRMAAVQGCRDIRTASASHSHCTCCNAAIVLLPPALPAQLPGGASRATRWPISPLQRPLHALGRFASKLPGLLWGMKHRWISCAVSDAVGYLVSGRSLHKAACPLANGLSSGICFNFRSKGTEHRWVDTLCDIQKLSAACWQPRSALVFLAQSVLCSAKS